MKSVLYPGYTSRLTQQLSKWATSRSLATAAKKGGRTQIISPSLCHDTLQRLAPSLQAHHGCDLIDINPGTCLWSRHLHDVLQPRRHILVEPERRAFDEFISPLIEENPVRYAHVETLPEALEASNGLLSDDIVKKQEVEPRTAVARKLLMTVNTTGSIDPFLWSGTNTGYFVNDFYTSFWGLRTNIHRYGLIRVLAWVPESHTSIFVPRTVEQRSRQSVHLEATSTVTEVASTGWNQAPHSSDRDFHWPDLALESANAVRIAEAAGGLETPEARKSLPPVRPSWSSSGDLDQLRELPAKLLTREVRELLELDDKLRIDSLQWRNEAFQRKSTPRGNTSEQRRWGQLLRRKRFEYERYLETAAILSSQRDLEQRWRHQLLRDEHQIGAGQVTALKQEAERLKTKMNKLKTPFLVIGKKTIDDYRAFDSRPQALAWNQRKFEPLAVQPQEFAPERPLSLIDIAPSPNFRQQLITEDQCEIFDYVIGHFWQGYLHNDVHSRLTALLQAGVDEFVETCPSLTDPVQGGWYDLTELRIRSISAKLYFDIALAFDKWPFRPPLQKILPGLGAKSRFRETDAFGSGR